LGYQPVGFDILPERVRLLNAGIPPYNESGLEQLLVRHLNLGHLTFTDSFAEAVAGADFIVIAVGTPSHEDGSCDLSALDQVFDALLAEPLANPIVVVRSTVPPGTTANIERRLEGKARVVFAPEFLREGSAVSDFLDPDRIVVGSTSMHAAESYCGLFSRLNKPFLVTSPTNAELIKCYSNAYLAMKISFANEVADLCDGLASEGANALEVLEGIGLDRRIGPAFLAPGIGFGGPCFEKDVKSMLNVTERLGTARELLAATLRVNEEQPRRILRALEDDLLSFEGVRIAVWGLAFKAGTDDVRDSLAIRIVDELLARGAHLVAYDPAVLAFERPGQGFKLASSALAALDGAEALVVLTEWPEYAQIPAEEIATRLGRPIVVDGRNVLDARALAGVGVHYRGVGRREKPDTFEREYIAAAG
jgi:UDPglucose 6-dehydrogenase